MPVSMRSCSMSRGPIQQEAHNIYNMISLNTCTRRTRADDAQKAHQTHAHTHTYTHAHTHIHACAHTHTNHTCSIHVKEIVQLLSVEVDVVAAGTRVLYGLEII